jgi:hypothetical protein
MEERRKVETEDTEKEKSLRKRQQWRNERENR